MWPWKVISCKIENISLEIIKIFFVISQIKYCRIQVVRPMNKPKLLIYLKIFMIDSLVI